ncbi:TMF family protein [Streptomyces sp. NPDC017454]|uniref:TMF family protein n=1 Tax=Streptomyces sp. NPDC017454 TaxID=3364997 RepID=UPI0037B2E7FC
MDTHRPAVALAQVVARVRAAVGLPATAPAPLTVLPALRTTPEAPNPVRERGEARREAELTRLASQLADRDRLLREKDETIAELRRQVQKLSGQLRVERESGEPETVMAYVDPERQFRHEVEQRSFTTVPEAVREERSLVGYRLGRDWLASLEAIELVDRSMILDVVVEVLTGRVVDNTARRVRRMRAGGGGSGPRVRDDGAVAWRCDVKQRAASAPRLMWWRLPDNIIERGCVASHDDMQLR